MNDALAAYWYAKKSSDQGVSCSMRKPKSTHIIEYTTRVDEQTIHHIFEHSDTKRTREFTSHHGYDRGVKRYVIIRDMLTKGE